MRILASTLIDLRASDGEPILDWSDLAHGAALLAAQELATNWEATVCDRGGEPKELLSLIDDVNAVICLLDIWRKKIEHSVLKGTFTKEN